MQYKKLNFLRLRNLFENLVSLSLLHLVNLLLPLVVVPFLLRNVGEYRYGKIVFVFSIINYLISLTDYGFKITGTRDISKCRHNILSRNYIFSKIITIKIFFSVIFTSILLSSLLFITEDIEYFKIVLAYSPLLLGYNLFPDWFFQGVERMKYISIINCIVKIIFTISIIFCVKTESDYWIYPLFQSLGFVISGIISWFFLRHIFNVKYKFIGFKRCFKYLKQCFPIFINQFLPTLYNNTTTFVLGLFVTSNILGIYDVLRKINDLLVTLISVFSRVAFPFLSKNPNKFDIYRILMIYISVSLIILLHVFKGYVFNYMNIDYVKYLDVLYVFSIGVFMCTLYDIYGLGYFIARNKDVVVMKITLIASLVGFFSSIPLIYYGGILGGAINLTISRSFLGLGVFYKFKTNK